MARSPQPPSGRPNAEAALAGERAPEHKRAKRGRGQRPSGGAVGGGGENGNAQSRGKLGTPAHRTAGHVRKKGGRGSRAQGGFARKFNFFFLFLSLSLRHDFSLRSLSTEPSILHGYTVSTEHCTEPKPCPRQKPSTIR